MTSGNPGVTPKRRRLPDRRAAETREMIFRGQAYRLTVGLFDDGALAEIFIDAQKQSTDAVSRRGALPLHRPAIWRAGANHPPRRDPREEWRARRRDRRGARPAAGGAMTAGRRGRWDDARLEALRDMLEKGASSGHAAAMLSERFGADITRNMVIGMAARRGMKMASPKRAARPKPKPFNPAPAPKVTVAIPESARVSLHDLRAGMCRFPIGDPKDEGFGFCGAPALDGKSWCARCHSIVFQPARPRAARRVQRAGSER